MCGLIGPVRSATRPPGGASETFDRHEHIISISGQIDELSSRLGAMSGPGTPESCSKSTAEVFSALSSAPLGSTLRVALATEGVVPLLVWRNHSWNLAPAASRSVSYQHC